MKKQLLIIIITLLAFVQQVAAQRAQVKFKNDIFSGVYSEVYQQPIWITYNVLCPNGSASREGMDFYLNDSIITSDNLDYARNEYDKGHLAPAADFNCDKATLFKTFSYLNCALQQENLNRGVWRFLELHERDLAKKGGTVSVKIELVFTPNSKKLPTGATIPDGFFKTISINGVVTECYYFPNVAPPKGVKYDSYLIKCKK
jgi:endonuclease G